MCAPIPKYKWSWKYNRCIKCGTTKKKGKHKHKGNGLCLSCFDKKRAQNPKRKVQLKNQHDKWWLKVKGTKEYKKYNRERGKIWRDTSKAYRAFLKKQYIRLKFRRIIKNRINGIGRNLKRNNNGIQFRCDGCPKNCVIKSTVKSYRQKNFETENIIYFLELFKQEQIKICRE